MSRPSADALLASSSQYRCTSDENPFELIHGSSFIYEMYNGKRFRISPDGFMQVNKQAAELVYRMVMEHAQLDENTVLLDIGSTLGKREDSPQ